MGMGDNITGTGTGAGEYLYGARSSLPHTRNPQCQPAIDRSIDRDVSPDAVTTLTWSAVPENGNEQFLFTINRQQVVESESIRVRVPETTTFELKAKALSSDLMRESQGVGEVLIQRGLKTY